MKKSFIHNTENNNLYLYNAKNYFSLLIHPELNKIHNKDIEIDKETEIDPYYLNKYKYLKKHGLFNWSKPIDFETILDESIITENIIHVPQVVFETTDHCNLNCAYCSLGELYNFGKKNRKNINTNYAINLLKYIFDIKPKKTKLTIGFFGGEPLVNFKFIKKIIETVNYLNEEKQLEIEFNMTTNATLIHKHIDFLFENDFTLLISIDGDEECNSYRTFAKSNKNSFQKVIENIDMIQKRHPEYFSKKIGFNAVLHNKNSIKDIYEFIYMRYQKIPRISQLNIGDINPEKKHLFENIFKNKRKSEDEFKNGDSNIINIVQNELLSNRDINWFLNYYSINYYILNLLYMLYKHANPFPTGTCFPFQRKIFLNTNNELLPCEKVSHKYSMGKTKKQTTININDISKKYNFYYNNIKNICNKCYSSNDCRICLLNLDNLEKLGTDEFICPGFQSQIDFKNRLNRIFSLLEKHPNYFFQALDKMMIE